MPEGKRRFQMRGAITALVTPFDAEGAVDRAALGRMAGWQVEQGIHGIVPCGTTGEAATLDRDERAAVISEVARAADAKVPVIAGCGGNDTRQTVAAAQAAADAGADALLVVSPYYNKPNRKGLVGHYQAVARATALPVLIYNVPGRTGQNLGADGILELAEIPGVVGVKEAAADLEQLSSLVAGSPEGFAILSGDDELALPSIALGAQGVISVVSNEAPRAMALMVESALAGDFEAARRMHFRLLPLMRANFVESNPVPVKAAMALLGHCRADVRLPLATAGDSTAHDMRLALQSAGIEGPDR